MTRRHRTLGLTVLISIVSLILPLAASAAVSGDFTYDVVDGDTVTITGCAVSPCPATLIIPATIVDLPVTSIGDSAFALATSLTSVTIPGSVRSIGYAAFLRTSNLETVTFAGPSHLETIGDWAFSGASSLTSITIPSSVRSIGDDAFYHASRLTTVTFAEPSSLETIDSGAFQYARRLTSITIPSSVRSIGDVAFDDATLLTTVTFSEPGELETIGYAAFRNAPRLTSITIPSSVETIGDDAFRFASSLTTVTFADPSLLTTIGNNAFEGATSLTSITIPSSVTTIGISAFAYASSLTTVTFADPSQLTTIGIAAFANATSLTSITIPSSVTTIGNYAFAGATRLMSVWFMGNAPVADVELYYYELYYRTNTNLVSYRFAGAAGWPDPGPDTWPLDDEDDATSRATAFAEVPATPPAPTAIAGNRSVVVTVAAGSGSGSPPTSYTVTANPGGQTCTVTGTAGSCTITGLTNGTSYSFTVIATNPAGTSGASPASSAVTPVTVPGAPTGVAGSSGNTKVVVSWLAPVSNGGSTITTYTVTASPGGRTCGLSSGTLACTVTGLTNGTSYTFTVTATNQQGTSPASGVSNAVTPGKIGAMKLLKSSATSITTQLNLSGPGSVAQVGTTSLSTPRASSEMAKKAGTMIVCTARKTVTKAGKLTIICRLTAKARAARKTQSLKVRLVTTFTPTGGTALSVSKTLVLKKTGYRPEPVVG